MIYPNFDQEKKLWKQGCKFVVGLDEAGRGTLAGPVVASAVAIKVNTKNYSQILKNLRIVFDGVKDSKKLSEKQREFFYEKLTNNKNIKWGIGIVSEKVIDKINILEATKLAMARAIDNLIIKSQISNYPPAPRLRRAGKQIQNSKSKIIKLDFILIDGNFSLKTKISQKSITKGDEKIFSCAAASIIAKVTRDKIMLKMHKKYPQYGLDRHKGYGTELHIKNLRNFGPCKIHRKTFYPVKNLES